MVVYFPFIIIYRFYKLPLLNKDYNEVKKVYNMTHYVSPKKKTP